MLELTKKRHTDGTVRLSVTVPEARADDIAAALSGVLRLVGGLREASAPGGVSASEALPNMTPGNVLRGARGLREMTQAQLSAVLGIPKSNISEMERGVRPIGKEMARRLGSALQMPYKSFL